MSFFDRVIADKFYLERFSMPKSRGLYPRFLELYKDEDGLLYFGFSFLRNGTNELRLTPNSDYFHELSEYKFYGFVKNRKRTFLFCVNDADLYFVGCLGTGMEQFMKEVIPEIEQQKMTAYDAVALKKL